MMLPLTHPPLQIFGIDVAGRRGMTIILYITTARQNNNKNRSWAKRFSPRRLENEVHYERRRPEATTLYQVIQEHLESFLAELEA